MNQRQKEIIRQKNIISELVYFHKKYLNEDIKYQMTPTGENETFIIKAIEDNSKPRDLNDEENEIFGGKPLPQEAALIKLKELEGLDKK